MDFKLVIFDVDGTLTTTKSGATFRKSASDWVWLDGRLEKLQELREQGIKIAYATNQGGVAFGYMQEGDIMNELIQMGNEGDFDAARVCYSHPKASLAQYQEDSPRRKPGPGMLLEIMEELTIQPENALMVGDRSEDERAAQSAGVQFIHVDTFFA